MRRPLKIVLLLFAAWLVWLMGNAYYRATEGQAAYHAWLTDWHARCDRYRSVRYSDAPEDVEAAKACQDELRTRLAEEEAALSGR